MNEIASPGQLRMSLLRWSLLTVPTIVVVGGLMGRLSNSGYGNRWFDALDLPPAMPPGWVFGAAWTLLYILIAIAFAIVLNARGARGRGLAITLFLIQLIANFAWSPLFFGMHQVTLGLWLILFILVAAIATTIAFGRVRGVAAWLMVPYLIWLSFASILAWRIDAANPDAESLAPTAARADIQLRQGNEGE